MRTVGTTVVASLAMLAFGSQCGPPIRPGPRR
jgi:hypothetical protein